MKKFSAAMICTSVCCFVDMLAPGSENRIGFCSENWAQVTTRSWDDKESGKKIHRTEIVVGDISLLSDNGRSGKAASDQRPTRDERHNEPAGEIDGLGITDDDVPF
jgi:hypothetical protein